MVFDNNDRPRLRPDVAEARACFSRFTALANLALMTLDDEQALWVEPVADAQLQRSLALPCVEVVAKQGAPSTLVRHRSVPVVAVPTELVGRVADTTAAGDSFAGAYLAARFARMPPAEAARNGNRLATRVVRHRGAVIPLAAMEDLLAELT